MGTLPPLSASLVATTLKTPSLSHPPKADLLLVTFYVLLPSEPTPSSCHCSYNNLVQVSPESTWPHALQFLLQSFSDAAGDLYLQDFEIGNLLRGQRELTDWCPSIFHWVGHFWGYSSWFLGGQAETPSRLTALSLSDLLNLKWFLVLTFLPSLLSFSWLLSFGSAYKTNYLRALLCQAPMKI